MDVFEAVDSRISCRWFLDKPVDPTIVRDLIEKAARAASGGNLQPWRVYALTGEPLAEIKRRAAADTRRPRSAPGRRRVSDLSESDGGAVQVATPRARRSALRARSASRATTWQGRLDQYKRNFEFFNAPVALFITIERRLGRRASGPISAAMSPP